MAVSDTVGTTSAVAAAASSSVPTTATAPSTMTCAATPLKPAEDAVTEADESDIEWRWSEEAREYVVAVPPVQCLRVAVPSTPVIVAVVAATTIIATTH